MQKHVIIHGRVQGVGYRAWTAANARKHGLSGWVRNLTDGTVEALFSGDDAPVETMLAACRRGPFAARVTDIRLADPATSALASDGAFHSRPTAEPGSP